MENTFYLVTPTFRIVMKVLYNVSWNYKKLGCTFNQSKVFSAKILYDVTKTCFYFMKNNLPHPPNREKKRVSVIQVGVAGPKNPYNFA